MPLLVDYAERRGDHPDLPACMLSARGQPDNLIYIGLTVYSDGLRAGLRQFHRSATMGQGVHAGGTYNKRFAPDVSTLLVAVHLPHSINANAVRLMTRQFETFWDD